MRNKKSFLITSVAFLFSLVLLACFVYRNVLNLPSPRVLLDLEFGWTPISQTFRLFSSRPLDKSADPIQLARMTVQFKDSVSWKGASTNLESVLSQTNTRAFLVIQDQKIAFEKYAAGYDQASRFASYSVAKSFVATLIGASLANGRIHSLQDRIGNYLEAGDVDAAYRDVTIAQLLSMRSGIDVDERYDSALAPVVQMYLSTDLDRFLSRVSGFRSAPGQRFEYRSVDTLVLAKVLRRATGMALTDYARDTLWNPLGAADNASWSVDSPEHATEKAFCCLNATARDFARLGMLYLAHGEMGGKRIVSQAWTLAPSRQLNPSSGMTYGDGWWIPPGNARDGDFSAIGIYGQYVYVNPLTHTVIVKLSEYGAEQDELATLAVLRQVAHSVSGVQ
ncbi:serine hydrolase domain-containing protein [Burkholderia gladioli]|uniref:serine hydrolase domain-containing protein n=1 Tax=Burkholderia gladioli TaxID=28095 RepID=UPI00068FBBB9|nr:serine hydrolase [Burkholderia gladioli]